MPAFKRHILRADADSLRRAALLALLLPARFHQRRHHRLLLGQPRFDFGLAGYSDWDGGNLCFLPSYFLCFPKDAHRLFVSDRH